MHLALSGATIMKTPLPDDIAVAGAAGFHAFEIAAAKLDDYLAGHSVAELRASFDEHSVRPAAIGAVMGVTFRPPAEYTEVQKRLRALCEVAAALDCREVVVTPGRTPGEGASWAAIRAETVRVLQELGDIAAQYDVRVAFEFLGYPWSSVRTLTQGWEVVKQAGRGNVKLVFDTAQFYVGGSELKSILDVPPEGIDLVHLCDVEDRPRETIEAAHRLIPPLRSGTVVPGEGVIPLEAILIRLRHIGYDKVCTVELFRPEYWEQDPPEVARRARAAALEFLSEYFTVE
jgi:2-keto-myo-inositol isomerase